MIYINIDKEFVITRSVICNDKCFTLPKITAKWNMKNLVSSKCILSDVSLHAKMQKNVIFSFVTIPDGQKYAFFIFKNYVFLLIL